MTNEEILRDLDGEALKNRGVNAIEALFAKIQEQDKLIKELKAVIANKDEAEKLCSESGFMDAKQVSKFLGCKVHRAYELAYSNTLKSGLDGKRKVFFWDDVNAYKQKIEREAGLY